MPTTLSKLGSSAKMHYKMQRSMIFRNWCMNQSCTLWILDSINTVKSMIALTNIFVQILKLEIQNYFIIPLRTRYWQYADEICYDKLKYNTLGVVIFGDFLVA